MYNLPKEIQNLIYEFDITYKEKLDKCIDELKKNKLFVFDGYVFYYYIPRHLELHITNSIQHPFYIHSSFNVSYIQFLKFKRENQLSEVKHTNFSYDSLRLKLIKKMNSFQFF